MSVFLVAWTIALALLQRVGAYNVSQIEISALHDLYTATNGGEWAWKYPLSSFGQKWNFSSPVVDPCSGWQGVTCTSTNHNFTGTVTSLNLKQYNLQGTIPSSISGLANLTFLDMDNNFLKSSIPNSIVSIPELSQLRLSYNDLTGHLPLEFFLNTSKLVYFSLTENYISGPLPDIAHGHSLVLTQIFFNGNELSGTIPDNIGSFANLIVLFIADNNLSGTIPDSIYDLVLLNRLALNGNDLHGTISSKIGQMIEMRYIYLHQCNLHGTLPDTIGGMYKLIYITFFINQLTGPLTTGLCNMTRLHAIAADTNYLTGSIPECFGQLTLMEQVNLYSNYLTGTMPSSLAAMTQLQIMLVQDNDLYGDPAPAFDRTTQLSLESVDLSSNQFSGALPVTVFGPALVTFAAFDTCFDGAIPEEICQAKQLESLALDGMTSRCALRIWPSFPNSPKVVTEVAGSVPHCVWSGLPNLTTLHLSSNSLTGTIPSLATYNNLTDLDLSFNLFSGSVPATLLGWHTLMNLNLKSNCFCGTITGTQTLPFAYHNGDKGTTLTLSSNRFSGIIPLELQAAIKMDVVDGNMFSCQYGHYPPYSDPNGSTYICGSNLLYVSLATLAGVLGVISMALLLFSRLAYRTVREHDMVGHENVPFRDVVDRMKEIYSSLPKISALLTQIHNSQDANVNDQDSAPAGVYYKSLVVTLISWKTQVDTLVRVEDTKHAQTMYLGKILKTSLLACEDPTLDCSCNELRSTNLAQLQSANVPHLVQFLKSLHLLRRIALLVFVAQILYTFPAYPILKYYYGTFLYQYGWYMSGAFISGVAAAIAVIAIWFVTLTIVLYVIVRYIPSRKALIYRVALQSRALELLQMYHKLEPDGQDNNRIDREAMRELAAAQVPVEMPQETYSVMNILPTALTLTRTLTVNRTPEDAENGRGSAIEMASSSVKNQLSTQPGTSSSQTLPRPRSDVSLSTNVSASSRSMRSTDNDSVSSCQSGVVKRRDKTVTGYLSQWFKNSVWISMMALLLNVVVVLSIKGAFVYLLNSNETSFVLKIGIEFALSAVDLMWGVMFVPVIITRLPKMKPSGRMLLKIGLLYFNSVIAPCLAIMFTESACLKGMFVKHTSVQELFNFSYCALYDPFDLSSCLGKAIWESELDYTPPFIYNFNCYSNVISAYTPIFIFSYCILALSLPLASMYITTLTKRRWYRGVVPGIFWVERPRIQATPVSDAPTVHPMHLNNNNTATENNASSSGVSALPAGQKIQTPKKRSFRPSSFLFFPGFILASTIHHILVLLTFGLMLPELGFAVVVVVFITTLTWEIILGRYLSRSPHCDPSKWQDPEESFATTKVCPVSGKINSKNSSDDQVKQDSAAAAVKASPASSIVAEQPDCSGGLDRLCIGVSCCPRKCKALLAYGSGIVIAFAVLEMVADKYAVFTSLWAPITCILLPAGLILYLKWQRVGTLDQAAYEASCAQQATTETMMLMRQTLAPDVTDAGTDADEESVNALNDSRDSQDDV